MKTVEFKKEDVIFWQGEPGKCMYDIQSGRVGIFINYGKENEEKLAELSGDTFFGEMGLVDNVARSATAVALEDGTSVCEIGEEDFAGLFAKNPERVIAIMQNLSGRLRSLTADYLNACRTVAELSGSKGGELPDELRERVKHYGSVKVRKS